MPKTPNDKYVVAHLVRGYLAPTETFISNQIATHQIYKPVVFCHHLINGQTYPLNNVTSVCEQLTPALRIVDRIAYKFLKMSIPQANDFLIDQILSNHVSLLHFHYLVDARFFLAAGKKTRLPSVVSAYGYDVSSFPRLYAGFGLHYLSPIFDQLDCFIAMSQDMRKDLLALGCPAKKIKVHYQGTNTRRFIYPERNYHDKETITILTCGSLEIKKAQHLTLQALHKMEQEGMTNHRFRMIFVGDGPMRHSLQRQVKDYGWQGKVVFLGHIPYNEDRFVLTYHKADIFSLPSITVNGDKEGIPGVIVEAMSAGLPVISTYHAGIPEIINSGREGILVNEKDVDGMARAFADLIENADLRKELGVNAAKRAALEMDLQKATLSLESIYREVQEG